MKFGGTSMDNLPQVASLIEKQSKQTDTVAVVSAFSGITNKLLTVATSIVEKPIKDKGKFFALLEDILQDNFTKIEMAIHSTQNSPALTDTKAQVLFMIKKLAEEILELQSLFANEKIKNKQFSVLVHDRIVGIGEFISSLLLARVLKLRCYVSAQHVDLSDLISRDSRKREDYLTSKEFLYGDLVHDIRKKLRHVLIDKQVPVLGGYIGHIPGGILQTIDRGYTDSTAALISVAVRSLGDHSKDVRLQIWKEVPGLMSADPRLVEPNYDSKTHTKAADFRVVKLRSRVSFAEAAELSVLGGMKAINPNGIHVLDGHGITFEVRNTFEPEHPGTVISHEDIVEENGIRFISGKKDQIIYRVRSNKMVNQSGVAGNIFRLCSELKIDVDAITTSATTVAFSVDGKASHREKLEEGLKKIGNVKVYPKMALVCCIGNNFSQSVGLLSRLSGILSQAAINIEFDCGDADNNITFIIEEKDCDQAIKALHEALFSGNVQNSGG